MTAPVMRLVYLIEIHTSEQFQRLLADNDITCSMSRAGNVWDNSAMESCFSSLKTERTRDQARADMFDYIVRFYNPGRRHSKLGGAAKVPPVLSTGGMLKRVSQPHGVRGQFRASLTRCPPHRQQLRSVSWDPSPNCCAPWSPPEAEDPA